MPATSHQRGGERRRPRQTLSRVLAGAAVTLTLLGLGAALMSLLGGPDLAPTRTAAPVQQELTSIPRSPTSTPAPEVTPRPAAPGAEAVGAAPMPAVEPVGIEIPAIGVSSELMNLGLQPDGTLEVPPAGYPAGWFTGAPTPGELGPAIIAGHVDWNGQPGVFFDLRTLEPGDEVRVQRSDGSTAVFQVTRVEQYPKAAFATEEVYGDIDHAGLRLITCGGDFDESADSYEDNIVAYARLTAGQG